MGNKKDIHRQLADYIYDDLSPEEIVEMESEISLDPRLSESYRLNMQVKDYLQAKIQLEEMRSDPLLEDAEKLADMAFELESMEEEEPVSIPMGRKKNRVRPMFFTAAIAATVSIIIAVGILPTMNQDRLFDTYYEAIEASDYSQRGVADEMYRDVANGINNYMDGNYAQSIEQFSTLASDPAFRSEVLFFTGLSYMGLGQYQDAQRNLELVLEGSGRYQPEALWYLSLCHLKTGAFEQANTALGELEHYDGLYKEDAQSLRKKLRRLK
jgi:tetratricopeptide (TPR) repeat protein